MKKVLFALSLVSCMIASANELATEVTVQEAASEVAQAAPEEVVKQEVAS